MHYWPIEMRRPQWEWYQLARDAPGARRRIPTICYLSAVYFSGLTQRPLPPETDIDHIEGSVGGDPEPWGPPRDAVHAEVRDRPEEARRVVVEAMGRDIDQDVQKPSEQSLRTPVGQQCDEAIHQSERNEAVADCINWQTKVHVRQSPL